MAATAPSRRVATAPSGSRPRRRVAGRSGAFGQAAPSGPGAHGSDAPARPLRPLATLNPMTTFIPGRAPMGANMAIAFLGPFGTFTEQAVHQIAPA